jgi:hypothetical protein
MKVVLLTLGLALGRLHATSLDVSGSTSAVLHSGDSLSFDLFTSNYAANALSFGLPADPSALVFTLITAPLDTAPMLGAFLESPDGAFSLEFGGPLVFSSGYFSSASYDGPVSALTGYFSFSAADSLNLFHSGGAGLRFVNQGADLELGLPPLSLCSGLFATLSGDGLSVGAPVSGVTLQSATLATGIRLSSTSSVPEPGSTVLLLGGGVLLVALSRVLDGISRRSR